MRIYFANKVITKCDQESTLFLKMNNFYVKISMFAHDLTMNCGDFAKPFNRCFIYFFFLFEPGKNSFFSLKHFQMSCICLFHTLEQAFHLNSKTKQQHIISVACIFGRVDVENLKSIESVSSRNENTMNIRVLSM